MSIKFVLSFYLLSSLINTSIILLLLELSKVMNIHSVTPPILIHQIATLKIWPKFPTVCLLQNYNTTHALSLSLSLSLQPWLDNKHTVLVVLLKAWMSVSYGGPKGHVTLQWRHASSTAYRVPRTSGPRTIQGPACRHQSRIARVLHAMTSLTSLQFYRACAYALRVPKAFVADCSK